jgi:hypothetical protein
VCSDFDLNLISEMFLWKKIGLAGWGGGGGGGGGGNGVNTVYKTIMTKTDNEFFKEFVFLLLYNSSKQNSIYTV